MVELDAEVIAQLEEVGGRELVEELFELYLIHAPGRVAEIGRALSQDEPDQAAKVVHSMRSSSATLGALTLADSLAELEELALAGDLETVRKRWPAIEQAAGELIDSLTRRPGRASS